MGPWLDIQDVVGSSNMDPHINYGILAFILTTEFWFLPVEVFPVPCIPSCNLTHLHCKMMICTEKSIDMGDRYKPRL